MASSKVDLDRLAYLRSVFLCEPSIRPSDLPRQLVELERREQRWLEVLEAGDDSRLELTRVLPFSSGAVVLFRSSSIGPDGPPYIQNKVAYVVTGQVVWSLTLD